MGNTQVKTAHLDKLAQCGVTYTNAHNTAVHCAPSRISMMTGLAPYTTVCYYDGRFIAKHNHSDITDISGWFRKNDYYTTGGGKLYYCMQAQINFLSWDNYFIWNEDLKKKGWRLDSWVEGASFAG